MCAKRTVKGSCYVSPVKQRIIAVEWHDHTDRQRGKDERARRTNTKMGWAGKSWNERGGKKIAGKGGQPEEFQTSRATATSTEADRHRSNIMWMLLAVSIRPAMNQNNRCHRHCIESQWMTRLTAIKMMRHCQNLLIPPWELMEHFRMVWPLFFMSRSFIVIFYSLKIWTFSLQFFW